MKLVAVLLLVAVAAVSAQYTTQFDRIDIDSLLKNERLVTNYINCLVRDGKCTTDATELKKLLPDALATGCDKCSDKQREGSKKVIKHLMNKRKSDWTLIIAKYDPTGAYQKNYLYLLD